MMACVRINLMLDLSFLANFDWTVWVLTPLLIFLSRLMDVTIGTIRIIFVARGEKKVATLLGFFEMFIWVLTIGIIMQNLDNITAYLAYAAGFSVGNYVGIYLEGKVGGGCDFDQNNYRKKCHQTGEIFKKTKL